MTPGSARTLPDFQPPPAPPTMTGDLFTGEPRYGVLTPIQSHDTKKKSGSSDGAHTYDTLKT
ncbi:hypothetical protein ACFY4C_05290 [Actinomadura viridis]|uniref:hypothetical protein n=1 Tax=Actinomadura viridis TaxID=58110 RepID=UPI003684C7C1